MVAKTFGVGVKVNGPFLAVGTPEVNSRVSCQIRNGLFGALPAVLTSALFGSGLHGSWVASLFMITHVTGWSGLPKRKISPYHVHLVRQDPCMGID